MNCRTLERVALIAIIILTEICADAASPSSRKNLDVPILLAEVPSNCDDLLTRKMSGKTRAFVEWAAAPSGLILGMSNDIALTITSGQTAMLPATIARWLPLFNEMANVAATSTGNKWIYSGLSKRLFDGVALGSIIGGSIYEGSNHGPLAGALTFATNIGLTYWFPNKYFHSLLTGIPQKLSPQLQRLAETKVGQAVIGVSMIVTIEELLSYSNNLIEKNTNKHSRKISQNERVPSSIQRDFNSIKLEHAIALYLLDGVIDRSRLVDSHDSSYLLWVAGLSSEGDLFSLNDKVELSFPQLKMVEPSLVHELEILLNTSVFQMLLSNEELTAIGLRLHLQK